MENTNQSPVNPDSQARLALIVASGDASCALPLTNIREVMRPLPTESVAGMPIFMKGISIIRGAPVPVVDLQHLLGLHQTESNSRYVLLQMGEKQVALAVKEVVGLRPLRPAVLQELPPLLRDVDHELVALIGNLDQHLLMVLEASHIIPQEIWNAL